MKDKIEYYLPEVIEDVERRLRTVKQVLDWDSFSTKLKSELISSVWETSFSLLPNVIAPKIDNLPDLYMDDLPLELKTSKTTTTWRGGEFSKRESNYLLIAWDEVNGFFKWFVCFTYLTEDDWKSSTSNNYYATTIDIGDVLKLPTTKIFLGTTEKKRIKEHIVF
jgi:hypothetical protein